MFRKTMDILLTFSEGTTQVLDKKNQLKNESAAQLETKVSLLPNHQMVLTKGFETLSIKPTKIQREQLYIDANTNLYKLSELANTCSHIQQELCALKVHRDFMQGCKQEPRMSETWEKINDQLNVARQTLTTFNTEYQILDLEKKIISEGHEFQFIKQSLYDILLNSAYRYYLILTNHYDEKVEQLMFTADNSFMVALQDDIASFPIIQPIPPPTINASQRKQFTILFSHVAELNEENIFVIAPFDLQQYTIQELVIMIMVVLDKVDTVYNYFSSYRGVTPLAILKEEIKKFRYEMRYMDAFDVLFGFEAKELITNIQKEAINKLHRKLSIDLTLTKTLLTGLNEHTENLSHCFSLIKLLLTFWKKNHDPLTKPEERATLPNNTMICAMLRILTNNIHKPFIAQHKLKMFAKEHAKEHIFYATLNEKKPSDRLTMLIKPM